MVLRTAQQVEGGLPSDIKAMMMFNIIMDFGIGLVPFLGDIADALFKANTRNAVILEKHLRKKGAAALKAHGQPAPALDPSDGSTFDRLVEVEENGPPPPEYTEGSPRTQTGAPAGNGNTQTHQETQNTKTNTSGGGRGSSFFGKKKKQSDLEQGGSELQQPIGNKSTLQKERR